MLVTSRGPGKPATARGTLSTFDITSELRTNSQWCVWMLVMLRQDNQLVLVAHLLDRLYHRSHAKRAGRQNVMQAGPGLL